MKIKDIMITEVVTVNPRATVFEIEQVLSAKHFHALPVVDDMHTLVGIITQYDLFIEDDTDEMQYLPIYIQKLERIGAREDAPEAIKKNIQRFINLTAEDIMTRNCLSLSPDSEVKEAILIFQKTNFGSIPVLDEQKKLVGLVTLRDVLKNIPEDSAVF